MPRLALGLDLVLLLLVLRASLASRSCFAGLHEALLQFVTVLLLLSLQVLAGLLLLTLDRFDRLDRGHLHSLAHGVGRFDQGVELLGSHR